VRDTVVHWRRLLQRLLQRVTQPRTGLHEDGMTCASNNNDVIATVASPASTEEVEASNTCGDARKQGYLITLSR